ncbi:MAG: hypothetical protein ACM31D_05800 [Bacteroidota bacterium]
MIEHLQINDVAPCVRYRSDGVQAAFTFPFAVFKAADMEVWVDNERVTAGITVSGVGISSGGSVLFGVPPAAGRRVTLRRRMALARTSDFQTDGIIRAKTLNDELDYQVAAVQQVADDVSRCLQRPFTSASTADLSLPDPAPGKALGWNVDGSGLVNDPADFATVVDIVTGQATTTRTQADIAVAAATSAQAASVTAQAAANVAQSAVGGVRVSTTDTTARALAETLVAGAHMGVTVVNRGGDETLRLEVTDLGTLAARNTVTASEIEGLPSATILGRSAPGSGPATSLALGSGLSLTSGVLSCTSLVDVAARDQLALTNLRLLLSTSVASGALAQGYQWELLTDEWSSGSSGYTFVANSPGYYAQPPVPLIPVMTGYAMPSGSASASSEYSSSAQAWKAFDGNTSTAWTSANTVTTGWLSYAFPASKVVKSYSIVALGDGSAPKNWTFEARTVAGSGSWTVLDTRTSVTAWTAGVAQVFSVANATAYQEYRANISANNGFAYAVQLTELQLYDGTLAAMVLLSPSVSVSSVPSYVCAYLLWSESSGSAVLGTDLTVELSRDGGSTWTAAALTIVAAYDGSFSVVKARADVTGQPSGTSMRLRIKTFNNKAQRVAAPALYKE